MSQCISDNVLDKICQKIGVKGGLKDEEKCFQIVQTRKKNKKCLVKADLQDMAKYFSLSTAGTVDDLLNRLEEYSQSGDGMEIQEPEREEKIVRESISQNVIESNTISCITFKSMPIDRFMTIVPVPKYQLYSGKWMPSGGAFSRYIKCANCPFYYSSGTSNEGKNFPQMWFPFLRIREIGPSRFVTQDRGWIEKAWGLNNSRYLKESLIKMGITVDEFILNFLEKFSHWWQVSISAALPSGPDCLWSSHKELAKLKAIAIEYDLDMEKNPPTLVKNPKIVTKYNVPECEGTKLSQPEQINQWLTNHNALCGEKDDS